MSYSMPNVRRPIPTWLKVLLDNMSQVERAVLAVLALVLLVSAVFSVTGFIRRNTHTIAQNGGSYTEAAVGQPRYLNPILAGANDLDIDISRLVYSSLFRLDQNLQLQNDLATEYSLSADNKEYTV